MRMVYYRLTVVVLTTLAGLLHTVMSQEDKDLIDSVWKGQYKNVLKHLDIGADPELQDPFTNSSLLMIAVKNHRTTIAQLLLRYGANVEQKDETGMTPLFYAVSSGNLPMVEMLLENGADPNRQNEKSCNRTVLMACVANIAENRCNGLIMKALFLVGGKVNAKDCTGKSLAKYVRENSNSEFADIYNDFATMAINNTILTDNEAPEFVVAMPPPNMYEELVRAVRAGDEPTVKLLVVDELADVESEGGRTRQSALFYAVISNNTAMTDFLLKHGANPSRMDESGYPLLYYAVRKGFHEMASLLIANGADPLASNRIDCGQTLLMVCLKRDNVVLMNKCDLDMAEVLRNNGTSADSYDCTGTTLMTMARQTNNQEFLSLFDTNASTTLLPNKAEDDWVYGWLPLTRQAVRNGNLALLNELLDSERSDINTVENSTGLTPLQYAINGDYPNQAGSVRALLDAGANVNQPTSNGSLLHAAVATGSAPLVNVLLGYHADVNDASADGNTTVLMSCVSSKKCNDVIVKLLLRNGADPSLTNSHGQTALELAAQGQNQKVLSVLQNVGSVTTPSTRPNKAPCLAAAYVPHPLHIATLDPNGVRFEYKRDDFRVVKIVIEYIFGLQLPLPYVDYTYHHVVLNVKDDMNDSFVYENTDLNPKQTDTISYHIIAYFDDGRMFVSPDLLWVNKGNEGIGTPTAATRTITEVVTTALPVSTTVQPSENETTLPPATTISTENTTNLPVSTTAYLPTTETTVVPTTKRETEQTSIAPTATAEASTTANLETTTSLATETSAALTSAKAEESTTVLMTAETKTVTGVVTAETTAKETTVKPEESTAPQSVTAAATVPLTTEVPTTVISTTTKAEELSTAKAPEPTTAEVPTTVKLESPTTAAHTAETKAVTTAVTAETTTIIAQTTAKPEESTAPQSVTSAATVPLTTEVPTIVASTTKTEELTTAKAPEPTTAEVPTTVKLESLTTASQVVVSTLMTAETKVVTTAVTAETTTIIAQTTAKPEESTAPQSVTSAATALRTTEVPTTVTSTTKTEELTTAKAPEPATAEVPTTVKLESLATASQVVVSTLMTAETKAVTTAAATESTTILAESTTPLATAAKTEETTQGTALKTTEVPTTVIPTTVKQESLTSVSSSATTETSTAVVAEATTLKAEGAVTTQAPAKTEETTILQSTAPAAVTEAQTTVIPTTVKSAATSETTVVTTESTTSKGSLSTEVQTTSKPETVATTETVTTSVTETTIAVKPEVATTTSAVLTTETISGQTTASTIIEYLSTTILEKITTVLFSATTPAAEVTTAQLTTVPSSKPTCGHVSNDGSFPWNAKLSVVFNETVVKQCAAVIISSTNLVSSYHCFYHPDNISVASINATFNDNTILAFKLIGPHPKYRRQVRSYNVAALLTLNDTSDRIEFNDKVSPICLPTSDECNKTTAGQDCEVSGFTTSDDDEVAASEANETKLEISAVSLVSGSKCQDSYAGLHELTETDICAHSTNGSTCVGNYGSSLVCRISDSEKYVLQGLSTIGKTCAAAHRDAVFTNICPVLDWLLESVKSV